MKICSILPHKEIFSTHHYGAVSRCLADLARESELRSRWRILGRQHDSPVLDAELFQPVAVRKRFFEGTSAAYARACCAVVGNPQQAFIECHNRPHLVPWWSRRGYMTSVFFHNDPLQLRGSKTVRQRLYLLQRCAQLIFNSEYTRQQFFTGISACAHLSDVRVQHFGVEPMNCLPMKQRPKQIIFVGKWLPEKGGLLLLQAMRSVLPRHPEWRLLCVGPAGRDSAYNAQMKSAIKELGPQCRYQPFLPQEQVMEAYQQSRIACLPSVWQEPFGRVVMEAMAAGCACVTTARGGIPEIVGQAGVLLNEASVASIARAVADLIAAPDECQRLQDVGLKQVATKFNLRQQSAQFDGARARALQNLQNIAAA